MVPMFAFVYGYMPLRLINSGTLFAYLNVEQATFASTIMFCSTLAFILGCFKGSRNPRMAVRVSKVPRRGALQLGAYALGVLGLIGWAVTIANQGGIRGAYGQAYGGGWSENGYIRDTVQLLIPSLLLLLSPAGFEPRSWL
jgi:hypothetical protein